MIKHPTSKLAVSSHHAVDSSFPVVADILCEFLEVAIHLILYVREVYPSGIFQKRKKYNVPVQVCGFTICSQFLMNSYPFISLNTGLLVLVCLYPDVMSPRAESVYPRYTSLCKAAHREGKTWPDAEVNLGKRMLSLIYVCTVPLPE